MSENSFQKIYSDDDSEVQKIPKVSMLSGTPLQNDDNETEVLVTLLTGIRNPGKTEHVISLLQSSKPPKSPESLQPLESNLISESDIHLIMGQVECDYESARCALIRKKLIFYIMIQ